MIKLKKRAKPNVLVQNEQSWTTEYVNCIKNGETPSDTVKYRYKHRDIKKELEKETHGKCAYCESKITHTEYGDIEHILPKNKNARPDLYVNWNNLTLACTLCNRDGKRDYYDPKAPLVNPYIDDPDDCFIFVGNIIHYKNAQGKRTIEIIKLNRAALAAQRKEILDGIQKLFDIWNNTSDIETKNALRTTLKNYCSPDKEYSAFARHFLSQLGFE